MSSTDTRIPDWPRIHEPPLFQGLIKQTNTDFEVWEIAGFEHSGHGEHDYLCIEKSGANTAWVARALARHAKVAPGDVGYAGLKDRNAVTRQWFSVRRPTAAGTDWASFELPGVRILDTARHQRKLKRGSHAGNRFRITIRGASAGDDQIAARLESISTSGVPNYFGMQRFGRQGRNLELAHAIFAGKRLKREQRSLALSAARSFLFNEILAERIRGGSWNRLLPGEACNLDGSNSLFLADENDDELPTRLRTLDIHPSGAMWGRGRTHNEADAARSDRTVVDRFPDIRDGLERAGLEMGCRALRAVVRDLTWAREDDALILEFQLGRGVYATAIVREIVGEPPA